MSIATSTFKFKFNTNLLTTPTALSKVLIGKSDLKVTMSQENC